MKRLVGEPGDDPRAAPIRALRAIIPPPRDGDDEAMIEAALLAELDTKTKGDCGS